MSRHIGFDQPVASEIDGFVFRRLEKLGIQPSPTCSDPVFVRRVFLDVIGTLPTSEECRSFLSDKRPDRRERLIDDLLARDEFNDYWAMKWSDLLRVKSEFPIDLWPLATQSYHQWIRASLASNMPLDRFSKSLLTATGSNFGNPEVNFYRAVSGKDPESLAKAVALTFMGVRAEKWPAAKLAGMSQFFSRIGYKATGEWKEEIVFVKSASEAKSSGPFVLPDGTKPRMSAAVDPRAVFSDWLTAKGNPWFARNLANRAWSWLMGRGIVHEPDDIRPDNPPRNPELLKHLERVAEESRFDMRAMFSRILNSSTYQSSSIPASKDKDAADEFAHYRIRRLEAEVLIDAVDQITGTTESYSSNAPEPFTFIPEEKRSITLADGSMTSAFLQMFGRPPRDTGYESERDNRTTSGQRLHMLNSSHIQKKIEKGPGLAAVLSKANGNEEVTDEVFLAVLSRFPSPSEREVADKYLGGAESMGAAARDLVWAALNSSEFLYRH